MKHAWKFSSPVACVVFAGALVLNAGCGDNLEYEMLASASAESVQKTNEYPAVVMVGMPTGYGICTGTFISPRAVITAAHCTLDSGVYRVYTAFGTFLTGVVKPLGPGVVSDPSDLSLLVFNRDIADPALGQVIGLGLAPQAGDEVRIIGYGCNDHSTKLGSGVKRTGTNKISRVSDYVELLTTPRGNAKAILGPANQAGSCFGDSGGPMLQVQNDAYRVVAVTHAGGYSSNLLLSQYVNVNRPENLEFIEDIDAEYELHVFDGCWNSADAEACGPTSASFKIFAFFKSVFAMVFAWF